LHQLQPEHPEVIRYRRLCLEFIQQNSEAGSHTARLAQKTRKL
jgi:hypothetical protein